MRDVELYRHLLGLEAPWTVARVELAIESQRVDVWAEHRDGARWPCPTCGVELAAYDHVEERTWRHLDSCQFLTYLHARPPRVRCPEHGVHQVRLSWAEPRARFTALFERMAIDVLRATDVQSAARLLRLSWDEAWHLMERAVARGLIIKGTRVSARLGIDEKAVATGPRYATIVCDLDRGTVEYVAKERRKESLAGYYTGLTAGQLAGIEAVAMDMWGPYIQTTLEHVPGARDKIVFDRFHIMQYLNEAVDTVRAQEHRRRRTDGDEVLKGTKHLWLYAAENLPDRHRERFAALKAANLKTGRAWALKESLRDLWAYARRGWAERHWKRWYFWATHSRLPPMIAAARTVHRQVHNVLTFCTHRITNAVSEGLNSKIATIQKRAYGIRNFDHFRTALFFHCGGLELYPVTHREPG